MDASRHGEIKRLISNYLQGTISQDDAEELRRWKEEYPENQQLMDQMENLQWLLTPVFQAIGYPSS